MGRGQVLSVHYCGKMVKAKTQLFDCYVLTFDFDNLGRSPAVSFYSGEPNMEQIVDGSAIRVI